ncbi:uncharacterized protein LOC112083560 [Eutrema salsugineum]|uniref:uncharacterized protein LOC112083560 n=1 Tax=Eutrema salsugineum TaxID=72664 RepID=UPI000CED6C0D|nr:uncharacterized protein LOC112083560 [Eutrema salsugineum]
MGEEPVITDLLQKTHMKGDGTFVDKHAKMIVEEVEAIVISQGIFTNTGHDEVGSQGPNTQTPITPLMRDEAFYSIVKPHKGKLFGLGSAQMEYEDSTDPPTVVLPRQARYERDLINLTEVVTVISQQITALSEAQGVIVPSVLGAEQTPHPS